MAEQGSREEFDTWKEQWAKTRSYMMAFQLKYQTPCHEAMDANDFNEERLVKHPHFSDWKAVNQEAAADIERRVAITQQQKEARAEKDAEERRSRTPVNPAKEIGD